MKRLKIYILSDNQLFTPSSTGSSTSSTINSTSFTLFSTPSTGSSAPSTFSSWGSSTTSTTRLSDTYIYGVGITAVLAIGACVFLDVTINFFRLEIKNPLNENGAAYLDMMTKKLYR